VRILAVNWQDREHPLAGGAEIHLHAILSRIAARGHEVTLLVGGWSGCPRRVTLDGMAVHRVGTRATFPFVVHAAWRREHRPRGDDVLIEDINKVPLYTPRWGARRVVAWVPHLFGDAAFQELGIPLATAVWLAERPLGWVYRRTPFEAISHSTADDLVARGIPRALVRVNHPGIDATHYTPDAAARAAVPTFAYLGRLKRYKGVHHVIHAFARVVREVPAARLEIAGAGDYRPALEALVASLDLTGSVRFLGFVDEAGKLALLRRAWALALASPKEGWGLTNVEAAACGTPVVASDAPGLRESVRDGETGFLVPHGDLDRLAAAFRALATDPARVAAMGSAGRAFATGFTWDRAADAALAHLTEIVSSRG
jgi:glycosyltransferase involved in cell wall biosynthesis